MSELIIENWGTINDLIKTLKFEIERYDKLKRKEIDIKRGKLNDLHK